MSGRIWALDFPTAKFDACLNLTLTVARTAFAGVDVIKVDAAEKPMVAMAATRAVRFNMAVSQVSMLALTDLSKGPTRCRG